LQSGPAVLADLPRELGTRAQHGDLTLLELRLRENVAVHVDEYLLDDLRSRRCGDQNGQQGHSEHDASFIHGNP